MIIHADSINWDKKAIDKLVYDISMGDVEINATRGVGNNFTLCFENLIDEVQVTDEWQKIISDEMQHKINALESCAERRRVFKVFITKALEREAEYWSNAK